MSTKNHEIKKETCLKTRLKKHDSDCEESIQEKFANLLSSDSDGDSPRAETDEDIELDLGGNGCLEDFNLIADALDSSAGAPSVNKTFSDTQLRDIERKNAILMNKILYHNKRPAQYKVSTPTFNKIPTSSSINRKKQQAQIDHDNLRLLKKINSVKPFGMSKPKN